MKDPKMKEDTPNILSNRDAVNLPGDASLSDSDPEESGETFNRRVEELSSSSSSSDEEVVRPSSLGSEPSSFRLAGGSVGFSYRSRNIFDQLEGTALKPAPAPPAEGGAFARPAPPPVPSAPRPSPPARPTSVPDYLLHPERWTRYDLHDTPETSDAANAQVALDFVRGLREGRRGPPDQGAGHRVIFSRPGQAPGEEHQSPRKLERVKVKVKELGLVHLDAINDGGDDDGGDDGDEDGREEKRQRLSEGNDGREEQEEQEEAGAGQPTFHGGKKVNRRNLRKTVDEEEEEVEA